MLRAARRLASWSAALELAAVAELAGLFRPLAATEGPPGEHIGDEIAAALTLTARAADALLDLASALCRLPGTRAALAGILPDFGTVQNPLDITGAAVIEPGIFTRCIEAVSADPSVGVVAVINPLPWHGDGRPWPGQVLADAIGAGASGTPVVCVSQAMQPVTGYTRRVMAQAGVPYAIPGLRHCVAALRNVGWWSQAT